MANTNTLTAVLDRILAGALSVLREACTMPALVNSTYSNVAGSQGSTLDLSVAGSVSASSVTPSNTPPDISGVTPTVVTMNLDKWYEAGFFVNDKEMLDIRDGVLPVQAQACVKALANQVNTDLLALYVDVYGYTGTAGTPPFGTGIADAANARRILADQLAPLSMRRAVIDPSAEANFVQLPAALHASKRGSDQTIRTGELGEVLGVSWHMDQAVPTHTCGTASGATTNTAGYAVGVTTITLASAGTGTIVAGDIFTIAGDTQTYVVTTGDADVSNGGTVVFQPPLAVAITTAATAITVKGSHVANLMFHPEAFGFANRPFTRGLGAALGLPAGAELIHASSMQDPISQLTLRAELTREHRRDKISFDILYGVKTIRREYAVRIAG